MPPEFSSIVRAVCNAHSQATPSPPGSAPVLAESESESASRPTHGAGRTSSVVAVSLGHTLVLAWFSRIMPYEKAGAASGPLVQDAANEESSQVLNRPPPPLSRRHLSEVGPGGLTSCDRSVQAGIVKATVSGVVSGVTSVVRLEPFRGALEHHLKTPCD